MPVEEDLITDDKFQFYVDNYAVAADAGIERATPIFDALSPIFNVRVNTFRFFGESIQAQQNFINVLQTTYETVLLESRSLEPMRDSFIALAEHVIKWSGGTLDSYLTTQGIKVPILYANISRLVNHPVSSENTK